MYGIHLRPVFKAKGEEICIHPSLKDGAVLDLCLMALSWLKFHLAFQINVPGSQDALIQIGIKSSDGHVKFRMVGDDLVRGLSL